MSGPYRGLAKREAEALLVRACTGNRAGKRLMTALLASANPFKLSIGKQAVAIVKRAIDEVVEADSRPVL